MYISEGESGKLRVFRDKTIGVPWKGGFWINYKLKEVTDSAEEGLDYFFDEGALHCPKGKDYIDIELDANKDYLLEGSEYFEVEISINHGPHTSGGVLGINPFPVLILNILPTPTNTPSYTPTPSITTTPSQTNTPTVTQTISQSITASNSQTPPVTPSITVPCKIYEYRPFANDNLLNERDYHIVAYDSLGNSTPITNIDSKGDVTIGSEVFSKHLENLIPGCSEIQNPGLEIFFFKPERLGRVELNFDLSVDKLWKRPAVRKVIHKSNETTTLTSGGLITNYGEGFSNIFNKLTKEPWVAKNLTNGIHGYKYGFEVDVFFSSDKKSDVFKLQYFDIEFETSGFGPDSHFKIELIESSKQIVKSDFIT